MNIRKFQLELMRAIIHSSELEYDDAYQIVRSLSEQITPLINRAESEKREQIRKEIEEKKRELQTVSTRSL